jgi:CRP-like cAMP-binding protein
MAKIYKQKNTLSQHFGRRAELEYGIRAGFSHAELASLMDISHGGLSRLMLHFWDSNLTALRGTWGISK